MLNYGIKKETYDILRDFHLIVFFPELVSLFNYIFIRGLFLERSRVHQDGVIARYKTQITK